MQHAHFSHISAFYGELYYRHGMKLDQIHSGNYWNMSGRHGYVQRLLNK